MNNKNTSFISYINPLILKKTKREIIIRVIKIVDIALIFSFYAIIGFLLSIFLNKLFTKYDEEKYTSYSTSRIMAEVCLIFASIGVVVYIAKNLCQLIPFPLDGYYGYKHDRVKELDRAIPLTYTILFFQSGLRDKLFNITKRYMN